VLATPAQVYIGYDNQQDLAYQVAAASLLRRASISVKVCGLDARKLASSGMLRRTVDTRRGRYDLSSNAPCATDFAISRFLVPLLAQSGWALFVDCDVLFLADIAELFARADDSKALMVVKHQYRPRRGRKMDGKKQTVYARKNWSSVMLFNCDHPANRRLSLVDIQERPGIDLHQFYWLHDSEIGALPAEWNWLVGEQAKPDDPKIAHYTLGGPYIPGWPGAEHDDLWLQESLQCKS